jgi:chromate transporter
MQLIMAGTGEDLAMTKIIAVFLSFLKVGLFGYGGGPSMVPLVQEEVVDIHHWLTNSEFTDVLAMGNSLPGPIVIKLAVFIGFKEAGGLGALAAVLGVSLPGIVGILALGLLFLKYKDHPRVQGLFYGIRPVIIAMLAALVYSLFSKSVTDWRTGVIMIAAFALMVVFNVHPIFMIIISGIIGMLII